MTMFFALNFFYKKEVEHMILIAVHYQRQDSTKKCSLVHIIGSTQYALIHRQYPFNSIRRYTKHVWYMEKAMCVCVFHFGRKKRKCTTSPRLHTYTNDQKQYIIWRYVFFPSERWQHENSDRFFFELRLIIYESRPWPQHEFIQKPAILV